MTSDQQPSSVIRNVRAEMARAGFTQTLLARHTGMSQQVLSRRLVGLTPFTVDELERIAAVLNVPTVSLLAS